MNILLGLHTVFIILNALLIFFYEINVSVLIANFLVTLLSLFLAIRNGKAKKLLIPFGLPILIVLINYYLRDKSFGHIGLLTIFAALNFTQTFIYTAGMINTKSIKGSDVRISFGLAPFFCAMYLVYVCLLKTSSDEMEAVYFNLAGFFILVISFVYLLLLNSQQRAIELKIFQIFTPSVLAILILLVSGSFLITNTTNNLVLKNWQTEVKKKSKKSRGGAKKKYNFDSQEIGYSADMKLANSTNLQKQHVPEIFMKLENKEDGKLLTPGSIYLKGASFDTFINSHWENYYDQYKKAEDGVENLADGVIRVLEKPVDIQQIDYTIYQLNGWHGNLLGLPNILSIKIDKLLMADNETYYLSEITGNRISYQAKSAYVVYDNLSVKDLVINDKHQLFLKTYGDVANRIAKIGKDITESQTLLSDKIEAIRYYLRQNFRYSLVTVNKDNKDPLENFFFHEKKGHCELYSTTMVMLLRGAGIPARQCVGYLGGNYNRANDFYVFYTDQAHAWVEICVEDYNWIPLDSSPIGPMDQYSEENNQIISLDNFFQVGPDKEKIRDARFASGIISMIVGILLDAKHDPVTFVNLVLLTYPISYFLFFGFLNFGRLRNRKSLIRTAKNLPYLSMLHKVYGKKPEHLTYLEYQERLKNKGVESNIIDRMIEYYYKVCYENQERSSKTEQEFVSELKSIKTVEPLS